MYSSTIQYCSTDLLLLLQVRTHFVRTIMRSRLEEAGEAGGGVGGSSSLPPGLGYLAHLYSSQGEVRAGRYWAPP